MTSSTKIRALIVDDEPLAREAIRERLLEDGQVEIAGEIGDGPSAVSAIKSQRPDLLFLDVQMPEMDGFSVLRALEPEKMPVTIFVTAYDKYSLQAFEAHALHKALQRGKEQILTERRSEAGERLLAMLEERLHGGSKYISRLAVKSKGRILFIRVDEIDWVEAQDNYLRLHLGKDSHLLRETMNNFGAKLDPERFIRIHRSTIVNVDRIKELRPWFTGEYIVVLQDGKELTLTRSYRDKLKMLLDRTA
jgi:two-component system LytT family response regulator